jgi:hypothetical protein
LRSLMVLLNGESGQKNSHTYCMLFAASDRYIRGNQNWSDRWLLFEVWLAACSQARAACITIGRRPRDSKMAARTTYVLTHDKLLDKYQDRLNGRWSAFQVSSAKTGAKRRSIVFLPRSRSSRVREWVTSNPSS